MNVVVLHPETVDTVGNRVFPTIAVETSLIVEKFRKGRDAGFFVSDKELTELIGCDIRAGKRGYAYVFSARGILMRNHAIVVERVKREGYRIATGDSAVGAGIDQNSRIRRAANKALLLFDAADEKTMSEESKRKRIAAEAAYGSLKLLSGPYVIKKIEHASPGELMPSRKVFDLFKS